MPYRRVSRINNEGGVAVFNYAVCSPIHVDILWSSEARKFSQLMANYSGPWQRASNSNYLDRTTGNPLGYVIKSGQVLEQAVEDFEKKYDGWWLDYEAYNHFVDPSVDFLYGVSLEDCELGINVGPLLVSAGQKTNLAAEINEAPYTGLWQNYSTRVNPQTGKREPILRVGMGATADGRYIIHVFCESGGCSLYNLQDFFMEFPGIWAAIAFDGGSSAGMIDKEIGTGVIGNDTQVMKTAFVMAQTESIPPGFPS